MEDGKPDDFVVFITNDYVVLGELTVRRVTGLLEFDIQRISFFVV